MNQKSNRTIILISLVIIFGIFIVSLWNYNNYSAIIRDDILNITKLTSTNMYSQIDKELTKPIFVSLTMANDGFLKSWIQEEKERSEEELTRYLNGIKEKYDYHSVFFVSDASKNYYHYNGFFKTITDTDQHDQWYYKFKESQVTYDLDVDQDEVDNQRLTIFINCEILDANEKFLGVTGVGVEMDYVQEMLESFESTYNLEAFLVNKNGLVQAHTNGKFIENRNISSEVIYQKIGSPLYDKTRELNVFHIDEKEEQYVISHYIEELDWFLIVRKDTSVLSKSFNQQLLVDLLVMVIVLVVVVYSVTRIVTRYQEEVQTIALTDSLTALSNRRCFDRMLMVEINQRKTEECLYIIDIDNFKKVNDTYGHLQGDQVLLHVTEICKQVLDETLLSRWGGDEFAGILRMSLEESRDTLVTLCHTIENEPTLKAFEITLSIGVTTLLPTDTADSVVKRADRALYVSKSNGKNKITEA